MRLELTLDCVDLRSSAAFWQQALGYRRESTIEDRFVSQEGAAPV